MNNSQSQKLIGALISEKSMSFKHKSEIWQVIINQSLIIRLWVAGQFNISENYRSLSAIWNFCSTQSWNCNSGTAALSLLFSSGQRIKSVSTKNFPPLDLIHHGQKLRRQWTKTFMVTSRDVTNWGMAEARQY